MRGACRLSLPERYEYIYGGLTMTDLTVAFIGLGLIGGSVAKGLKRRAPGTRIMAYMRTREKLKQAKRDGIVDVILDGVD